MRVEFILDYRSPYAYLLNTQMKNLNTTVEYRPIDIVEVMKKVNNQPSPLCPPKGRYALFDAGRWAQHYGVGFTPNMAFLQALREGRFEGTMASRAALAAQQLGVFDRLNDALFTAIWAGTDDLVSDEGRAAFLVRHHIAAPDLWRLAEDPSIRKKLAEDALEFAERGVFGVPTVFVDSEMFFGNDRLDFIRARLQRKQAGAAE
ncbi:MAG: DsbA family protein [Dongiaceae bacterium]